MSDLEKTGGSQSADDLPVRAAAPDAPVAEPYDAAHPTDDPTIQRGERATPDSSDESYSNDRNDTPLDDSDDVVDADQEVAPAGGGRPPLAVMIVSGLLLLAIGVGIGAALLPALRPQPPAAPTSAAALPTAPAQVLDGSPVPTALPLPEAIGTYTDTETIVMVNDVAITRGDFVRLYQPGSDPQDLLNQMIEIELVVQAAAAEGATVDETAVDEQINQFKTANSADNPEAFTTFLQSNKIASEEELRKLLRRDQLVEKMLLSHTTLEQAHARHILLAAEPDKVDARKAEAEALLAEIQGGADFAKLAAEKSEDPGSKENGGDLGWVARGAFVPEFDEAMFTMKADELRLVQSQFGWHIIQLIDEPEVRALSSRDMLNTPSGQEAFSSTFLPWVKQLRSDADAAKKVTIMVPAEELVNAPAGG